MYDTNNRKSKNLSLFNILDNSAKYIPLVAVLTAATLVVGGTFAATSAFAYQKKGGNTTIH
jgi:hypothetical protein